MIQIYVDFEQLPFLSTEYTAATPLNPEALQWQILTRVIKNQTITFAMDLKTHYWLCFNLDGSQTIEVFTRQFHQYLLEQVIRVCGLGEEESIKLAHWVNIALEPMQFHERNRQSTLPSLKRNARFIEDLLNDDYPMPVKSLEWFELSLPFNRMLKQNQSSLAAFQHFWLGLLQFMEERQSTTRLQKATQAVSNVIPFKPKF